MPPICTLLYVNMLHDHVDMRLIDVNMLHNDIYMQLIIYLFLSICYIVLLTCITTCNINMFIYDFIMKFVILGIKQNLNQQCYRSVAKVRRIQTNLFKVKIYLKRNMTQFECIGLCILS